MSKTYSLFISHSWAYRDTYYRLIEMLNSHPYFKYRNLSVPFDSPIHNARNETQLYSAIYNQIKPCSLVLVFGGVYSTYSKWINYEINIAKNEFEYEKPIVAIMPRSQFNMSRVVEDAADEIVYWNTKSIIDAIRRHSV